MRPGHVCINEGELFHISSREKVSCEVARKIIPDSEMRKDLKWNQSPSASAFASNERKIFHPSS
jgi:hypothetical protein